MRRLLILAVLLASPAAAQGAGQPADDRYGSGAHGQTHAPVAQPYSGRVLTWSGKVVAARASSPPTAEAPRFANTAPQLRGLPPQAAAPIPFQPQAPYAAPVRQAQAAPVAPASPIARVAPTAAIAPVAPVARTAQTAPKALPASLYGAASKSPVLAGGPPVRTGTEARLYSLHREYGLQPDTIPEPPAGPRYVLMGPPDHATAPQDDAKPSAGGVADAPF